jgi:hypothetical protein
MGMREFTRNQYSTSRKTFMAVSIKRNLETSLGFIPFFSGRGGLFCLQEHMVYYEMAEQARIFVIFAGEQLTNYAL